MIPQIGSFDLSTIEIIPYPSRTYRLTDDRIEGFVDGIEAMKQAVFLALSTQRFAYSIYDDSRGAELEQYIGKSFPFVKAGAGDSIEEALLQDDRIVGVDINSITQTAIDSVLISITVQSTLGTFEMEVPVNV